MLERLALGLLWLLHLLPSRVLAALGSGLGNLLFALAKPRREVALKNLALCFPEKSERERRQIAREHFQCFAKVMLEQGITWWAPTTRILEFVRVSGLEHWQAARGKPIIWLAPHFLGLDVGGVRISALTRTVSVYAKQKSAVLERMMLTGRNRFTATLFSRQEGLLPVMRAIRRGEPFYYLPDLDFGPRDAVFVPFFGVQAATITGLARIAKLTGARVLPAVTRQLPRGRGYELKIYPAWENYPADDLTADTRRMNAFIEERVREMPAQYLWTHKRFKTRPPGAAKFY
jgi:Kdo2-lipid IVA lauroyltransferase/acyltransferase